MQGNKFCGLPTGTWIAGKIWDMLIKYKIPKYIIGVHLHDIAGKVEKTIQEIMALLFVIAVIY